MTRPRLTCVAPVADPEGGEHGHGAPGRDTFLHLFGGPFLTFDTRRVDPPDGSKRLLALLALEGSGVDRRDLAGRLWPDVDYRRAEGNLRSALWRLHRTGLDVIDCAGQELTLQAGVEVDVQILAGWAHRIISGQIRGDDLRLAPAVEHGLCVLPGWYDDWVVLERERLRSWLLQALEVLTARLCRTGRHAEGIEAAVIAVAADPLRESAQRALIEAHLAEGNLVEAHRARDTYRDVLRRELGAPLSPQMCSLLAGFSGRRTSDLAVVR